ncbi:MAG: helix-hairpin-helix domain-containing protein [Pedobacter sp.]|nr:helix-hairpin-helix domain-containing protein [Pedobacter sp.]
MYRFKNLLRSYFSFSKKELNGIFVLFILMGLVLIIPYLYPLFFKDEKYDFESFRIEAERFRVSATKREREQKKGRSDQELSLVKPVYFEFDPNGLSDQRWLKLGLSAKQIRVIRNYELKGGRFFKKEDLRHIYSISPEQYKLLEPFIRISNTTSLKDSKNFKANYKPEGIQFRNIAPIIELNSADSIELESVRGIGPAFASRIIRFRKRLGGFYRKEQLLEVYGMDSVKYDQLKDLIKVNQELISKINLNTFTFEEIRRHPYLTYKQMNAIIQYRSQHGLFKSIDDLIKIAILSEEIIRKIEPYIVLSP